MIDHLEELRPTLRSDAAERADDHIVDELRQFARLDRLRTIRIEDLEEMLESLALGLFPKKLVLLRRLAIERGVVIERDAVEAEVGAEVALIGLAVEVAALDMVQRRRTERPRRIGRIATAAHDVDIGGIVGPGRRRHVAVLEQPLLNGERLARARRHQHDIDEPLLHDLLDDGAKLGERAITQFAGVAFRRATGAPMDSAMSASFASARMKSLHRAGRRGCERVFGQASF